MGKPTFTKTNLVHANSKLPVYKKNGVNTYWSGNNKKKQVLVSNKVQKLNGTVVTLKDYKKSIMALPVQVPIGKPTFTKTNLVHANSKLPIYKKNGVNTYWVGNNKKTQVSIAHKVQKPNGTVVTLKDYKNSLTSLPVQVPIAKHTPAHIKTGTFTKVSDLLKVIARRKKALAKVKPNTAFSNYCANKNKGIGYINRLNAITFTYPSAAGMGGDFLSWKTNFDSVKFQTRTRNFNVTYNQYHFARELKTYYYPVPQKFENISVSNMIDMEWFQAQNKFIRTLGPREIFLMFGYSHNGDSWAHSYLDGTFNLSQFKSGVNRLGVNYFALFFQARDVYKINTGDMVNDYNTVLTKVKNETDENVIKSIIQMFIDELNILIEKAPVTKKAFTVFRGVKDDKYMSGIQNQQYVLNRFCSTTLNGNKSKEFSTKGGVRHTILRILIMPGSKCLCMFGFTRYADEFEILLPRGTAYMIRKTENNVATEINKTNICRPKNLVWSTIKNVRDVICLGITKKYTTIKKTIHVPVTVSPNVAKAQKVINESGIKHKIKLLSHIGAGGYGTVFQGTNNKGKNVAVKFQENSNNSRAEIKAIMKLRGQNIAPKHYTHVIKHAWNQNFANLVPKGLGQNKKGTFTIMKLIKGKPLKNYMTGAPLNAALKQKIVNKVAKMHAAGVIHGDLHRNNIIINNKGEPWIIDFGKSLNLPAGKNANNYVKGFGHGSVVKYGKTFWYSNAAKTRSHQANGNFLKRLI